MGAIKWSSITAMNKLFIPLLFVNSLLYTDFCGTVDWTSKAQTVINVPPDTAPDFIDSDTILNLFEPHSLDDIFDAGLFDGTSTNVTVNINEGTVGYDFHANGVSTVNISGHTFGDDFDVLSQSTVNLSGTEFYLNNNAITELVSGRGLLTFETSRSPVFCRTNLLSTLTSLSTWRCIFS